MAEKDDFNELSLDELIERNKQVKELLAHLEDEYRSAAITENSYKQAKGSNTKKLEQIRKKLEEFGVKDDDAPPPSAPKADAKPPQSAVSSGLNAAANQAPVPTSPAPAAPAKNDSAPASTPASTSSTPAQKSSFFSQLKSTISQDKGGAQSTQSPNASSASSAASASSSSFEPEIHRIDQKFSVELERIKTTLDAIKETKSATDERIQRMTESITELRSMIFQRETILKSYDIKIEKLGETMADIEPQKIIKEFNKRDKVAAEAEAKIEKLERKAEDMMKTINETNALMKSIGGLQNIAEVDHEIMKKVAHMQEMTTSVERFSEKTEKMFVEVNKKLEEFTVYKMRQENLEEVVRDLVKNSDRMGIKFENYLERKELDAFRNSTGNVEKQFELLKKSLKRAVPFIEAEIPKEMLDLQREKEDVELLISGITFEFQQKRMSEKDYMKALEKNRAKIADIDAKLKDAIEKLGEEEKAREEAKASGKASPKALPQAQKAENPAAAGTAQNPATPAAPAKSGAPTAASAPAKDAAKETKETAEAEAANADESESEESEGSNEGENSEEESASDETGGEAEEGETSEEPAGKEEQEKPTSKPAKKLPKLKHAVHHKSKKLPAKNSNAHKPKKTAHTAAPKAHAKHKTERSPDTGMFNRLLRYNDAEPDNKHKGKGSARVNNMKEAALKRASGAGDKSPALKMSDAGDYLEFKATHASHAFHKKKAAVKAKPKKSKVHKHKSAQKKIAKPKAKVQKKPKQKKIAPQPKPKSAPAQVSKPAPKPSAAKSSAFGSLGSLGSSAAQKSPKAEPEKAEAKPEAKPAGNKKESGPAEKSAGDDNSALIAELEDSYKQGLITKEAYQHTKKVLLGK